MIQMHYYVAVHDHNHGTDIVFFKSRSNLADVDVSEIAKKLDMDYDYDPEFYAESLEIIEVYPDNCNEI